jgi:hypothetical protein
MDESTVRWAAISFMVTTLAMAPVLFYFLVVSFYEGAYAESAFLMGVVFVLVAQLVYYYERAFTPAEIWRTKGGFMVRMIGEKPSEKEPNAGGEDGGASSSTEKE